MRRPLVAAVVLVFLAAACGGPGRAPTPVQAPPAQLQPPRGEPPSSPSPPSSALVPPDVPSEADAARDAELARTVAGVIDIVVNTDPVFTRDGKHVVFLSNRDGLPQLYLGEIARPAAPPLRLVRSTERQLSPVLTPDGKALVFRSDHGADENWSYFRVNLDGSGLVELTPGTTIHRDSPRVADGKPDTIFYSARTVSDTGVGVYLTSATTPGAETQIYRDSKPGALVDISRDGRWALFWRYPSHSENYLLAVDLESGAARQVYPSVAASSEHGSEHGSDPVNTRSTVTIFGARFSADGKRALIATDGGAEQALVLSIDIATGRETARYVETRPATAEIGQIYAALSGNTVVAMIDAGDHCELRVLDATTLAPKRAVTLPLGSGTGGGFSQDGQRFALTWSTPNVPHDVYAVDLATGKVAALRSEARPQLDGLPRIEASIAQVEAFDHLRIPINVFLPAGRHGQQLPVIVDYHGGPNSSAWVQWQPSTRLFVGLGYALVQPNVRGSTGFGRAYEAADNGPRRLDAFKDVETTARWAASQPWADPRRMVVSGGSYGGYTVLIALTRMPEFWRAGIEEIGVSNLRTMLARTNGTMRELFRIEFGDLETDAAFLDSISPLRDADKIVAPLFVYAGAHDTRALRSESDLIVKALRARKVPVEYMVADNEGHSMDRRENQLACHARMIRFLETHVK
jgi:dipeptidyl aminopeptidase/acylaminoacyl peptidase